MRLWIQQHAAMAKQSSGQDVRRIHACVDDVARPLRPRMRRAIPHQICLWAAFVDDDIRLAVAIHVQKAAAFGERTAATADYEIVALWQLRPQKPVTPGNERAPVDGESRYRFVAERAQDVL